MVASLVLGSRFRPIYVWIGVASAFLVHVTVAVAAGSAFSHLPGRLVDAITMVLFLLGAVLVLREGRDEDGQHEDGSAAGQARADGTPAGDGARPPSDGWRSPRSALCSLPNSATSPRSPRPTSPPVSTRR
ncbi:TMEM165/GDT1 family protein [Frankia sp. R82]|uniref:TMEM165/GDT1 family protein n=1 Tax=Frankia sp. R82 TaxID=2950553 RepID=UPI0027E2BF2F|nr:TMEM165/GDT1 family protein [Frankia sp. R82]